MTVQLEKYGHNRHSKRKQGQNKQFKQESKDRKTKKQEVKRTNIIDYCYN